MKKKIILPLFTVLFLTACNDDKVQVEEPSPSPTVYDKSDDDPATGKEADDNEKDEPKEEKIDFTLYFKPADSTAYFIGEGNEFATFNVKTIWLSEQYAANVEDNGGVLMLRIYRLLEDKIEIVLEEVIEGMPDEVTYPEVAQLEEMEAVKTYLAAPIEVGTTFDNWTIVKVGETLETPYKTFENVFVIEETGENFINRKYFVEGFGEIKRESIMQTDHDEEYIVTSTLESITMH